MIVNKYANKCQSCGTKVPVGKGFAYTNGNRWFTACASKACHKHLGLEKLPTSRRIKQSKSLSVDGFVTMPFDKEALPLLRSLPKAKWNPDCKKWSCSVKPGDLPRTLEIAAKLGLDIPDELKKLRNAGTKNSKEAIKRADRTRVDGNTLYPFQKPGVEFLALRNRALLADDMGLGKTVQALVALPVKSKSIVVAPAAVKYNWEHEIKMWRPDLEPFVCSGKKGFRLPSENEVCIVNYDILPPWLKPTKAIGHNRKGKEIKVAELTQEQIDALKDVYLIADEAHLVKNYKTARSQKMTELCKAVHSVWFLTGTPLMNRPFDLYGVLSSGNMNPFSWSKFMRAFNGEPGPYGGYVFGMPEAEASETLRSVMLRRLKKDVLKDLPPKTYQDIVINGTSKEFAQEMDKFTDFWKDQVGSDNLEDLDVYDLPSFEEFSKLRAKIAKSRIPAMIEIVESYEETNTPLVVFSAHRAPVDTLSDREGWTSITGNTSPEARQQAVQDFQSGMLKGIALTIQAGGVGLTLTHSSNVLFVDLDWTPAMNIQAEDRICRIGQTSNRILIQRMVSKHPLDIHIQNLIKRKVELAYRALDNSFDYTRKPLNKANETVPELIDETDEDRLERINAAENEANKQHAKSRVQKIYDRGYDSWKLDTPEPELTTERKEMLRDALSKMCSVCDGAFKKDGIGFNKPDSHIGHWLNATGLEENDDVSFRVLERILCKYRRQLKDDFDQIWKPE